MAIVITGRNGCKYSVHDYIGRGSFSKVFKLECCLTKRSYAGKFISKEKLEKHGILNNVWNEIKIHQKLRHQNIVQFFSYIEQEKHIVIILEHCSNDSMVHLLNNLKRLRKEEAKFFMLQIVSAVEYMHSRHIVHRDLKLGNLFIHRNFEIKVGDFGLAVRIDFEGQKRYSRCGTPNYLAPEIINGHGHSYAVDIWALGCILYTMLQGTPPFQGQNVTSTYHNILNGQYKCPTSLHPIAKVFIVSCLNADPSLRPNVYQLASTQFLSARNVKPIPPNLNEQTAQNETAMQTKRASDIFTDSKSRQIRETNFLNRCFRILSECLENVQNWTESNFGEFLSEYSSVVPFIWVNSWIDYTNSFGFAYQLNNKNFGMLFNDNCRLLYDQGKEYIHVTHDDGSVLICNKDSVPHSLQKKMQVLSTMGDYMRDSLLKAYEGNASASPRPKKSNPTEVLKWARGERELAMFMTNGSMQLNFLSDHTKLILCGCTRTVTVIESQNYMKSLKLDSLQKCGCSGVLKYKLLVALYYIQSYFANNDTVQDAEHVQS